MSRWNDEEGWGVLNATEVAGEIWVHFSSVQLDGYRGLIPDQRVEFECEPYPAGQDGFYYRAHRVRPI